MEDNIEPRKLFKFTGGSKDGLEKEWEGLEEDVPHVIDGNMEMRFSDNAYSLEMKIEYDDNHNEYIYMPVKIDDTPINEPSP